MQFYKISDESGLVMGIIKPMSINVVIIELTLQTMYQRVQWHLFPSLSEAFHKIYLKIVLFVNTHAASHAT